MAPEAARSAPSRASGAPSLPGYRLEALLHVGRHSAVWRGQREDGTPVVVKFHGDRVPTDRQVAGRRRAFELGRELGGAHVVGHLDLVPHGGGLVIVTEDFGGASLDRRLERGAVPVREALDIALAIVDGVWHLHRHGVIHKDLKPANVVRNERTGVVKLIDLGLASRLSSEQAADGAFHGGTLAYLAPEQTGRTNRAVDARTDLYALGVTLYELLCGHPPFRETDPREIIHAHIAREPPPLHERVPGLPLQVSRVVHRLLAKDPADRYQSAVGLRHDLVRCIEDLEAGRDAPFELGERDVSPVFRVPDALYGRGEERAALLAAFARSARGAVEALVVSGAPGIGKSALVREVQRPIAARGGWFVEGKFDQFRRDLPYLAWTGALQALVRQVLAEPEERLERLRAALADALGPNRGLLTDLVPELEALLGAHPPPPSAGPAETQARLNQSFRQLMRQVATADHPLVVFLDDLQWADLPSLRLLEVLGTDREVGHLLILGAYRDGEVGPAHPLQACIAALEERGQHVGRLALGPLALDHVTELLSDALRRPPDEVRPLAEEVHGRTGGNPFFVRQFIERVVSRGAVRFDPAAARWVWDLDAIAAEGITDNVADLVAQRLDELGEDTRRLLELGACLGARFDLAALTAIEGGDRPALARALLPALEQGLVLPLDEDYKYAVQAEGAALNPAFRFLHDRVQQAAHDGIDPERRAKLHLDIGLRVLADTPDDQLDHRAVDIADHLAMAVDHVPAECRAEVAAVFLRAARRARESMAVDAAARYAEAGLALVGWDDAPELARQLHTEAATAAYIDERFDDVGPHAEAVLSRVADPLQRVAIYNLRIGMGVSRHEYVEATRLAVRVLAEDFGVRLPPDPGTPHVLAGLLATTWRLRGRTSADILNLPEMTDPKLVAAMELLMKTATNAYWGIPDLVPLIAFKMIELSLAHGHSPVSAYGYGLLGMVQTALGNAPAAYRYGKLAMELIDRQGATHMIGRTGLLWHGFIRHLYDPMRVCAPELLACHHHAMDSGDVENAAYCITVAYYADLLRGLPLHDLERQYGPYVQTLLESGQEQTIYAQKVWLQAVDNLRAAHRDPVLTGEWIDFPARLAELEAQGLDMVIVQGVCAAGWLAFVVGDEALAVEMWEKLAAREDKAPGQVYLRPCLAGYAVLLERRRWAGALSWRQRARLEALHLRVRTWARQNPEDFGPYAAWLAAERAVGAGRDAAAQAAFVDALERAGGARNRWLEALISERAGRWHLDRGRPEAARRLLDQAATAWRAFGLGSAGASLLDSDSLGTETTNTVGGAVLSRLDRDAVIEAVQLVASEIEVDALAARATRIALVVAGATRAVLVLDEEGRRVPCARAEVAADGALAVVGGEDAAAGGVPELVVDYVARTRRVLLVDDAREHPVVGRDPALAASGARAILGVPVVRQGRLLGVLILENARGAGMFTELHAEVVEAIAGQAAISLENARLFERERHQAEAFARFVPRPFLENLGYRRIEDARLGDGIARHMSILFSDLRGFTAISEQMSPEENFTFINNYLARMTPAIENNGGFVDAFVGDAVMALFVADADGAVRAGVEMHRALHEYNAERARRGRVELAMGVGVHTGEVLLGIIGSPTRMQANVKGDAVNTASRLEGLTKHYHAPMLISEQTRAAMREPARWHLRPVGRVQVKGRREPVSVHEVLDAHQPGRRDALAATAERFAAALERYLAADFGAAQEGFAECLGRVPDDLVARRFHDLSAELGRSGVPDGWTGVDVRTVK